MAVGSGGAVIGVLHPVQFDACQSGSGGGGGWPLGAGGIMLGQINYW